LDFKSITALTITATAAYLFMFMQPVVKGLELNSLFLYMDVFPAYVSAAGYTAAYLMLRRVRLKNIFLTVSALSFSAAVIGYWHIPVNSGLGFGVCPLDLNNPFLYNLRKATYFAAGFSLYIVNMNLSRPWREALAIALGKAMAWYGFYLTLLTTPLYVAPPIYYSLSQHHETGFIMILTMIFLDFLAVISLVSHYFRGVKPMPYPLVKTSSAEA